MAVIFANFLKLVPSYISMRYWTGNVLYTPLKIPDMSAKESGGCVGDRDNISR